MPIKHDTLTPKLAKIADRLDKELAPKAFRFFKGITPKRSGNAQRKTRLQGKKIVAGYNYASKLDSGSSRKAPDGMSNPTGEFLDKLVKRIIGK